jgi:hypothetical protein
MLVHQVHGDDGAIAERMRSSSAQIMQLMRDRERLIHISNELRAQLRKESRPQEEQPSSQAPAKQDPVVAPTLQGSQD